MEDATSHESASGADGDATQATGDDSAADAQADTDDADDEETDAASAPAAAAPLTFGLLFQAPDPVVARAPRRATSTTVTVDEADDTDADDESSDAGSAAADDDTTQTSRSRRRGGRGRRAKSESDSESGSQDAAAEDAGNSGDADISDDTSGTDDDSAEQGSRRRTRRRRRSANSGAGTDDPPGTVTKVREPRGGRDEVTAIKGSTRLEAKKQRRREGREAGRRRTVITEAEFLARRESVDRVMVVREKDGRTQIGVLEDGVLVEHYVSREVQQSSMAGNVYLGKVQNVLPSMEAAFVDIGQGRNGVLYAGEVNWDAAGLENGQAKRIENAMKSGTNVLVQVTKDPIGHKGARLTSQVSLPGRFLVYVPGNSMTGISRKLPDTERARLKKILKEIVPADAGVIVRTAAEGASEADLRADVERLQADWEQIQADAKTANAPSLLHGEPDLTVRVIRDVFNEDFAKLVVSGDKAWNQVQGYLTSVAPDLAQRLEKWTGETDIFSVHRIDEQLAKAMDRKVWLPSGGSLIIDRTEAMTVIDVNTGKFVGSGGNLEETVTKNNIEAAEEIVRQLRLRDIGGIIVVDFIDMVLESNRDLVVRRLLECLGRDRTKHQVAEVTSLGLVQMTRKRVGSGLIEIFSEPCEHCGGRGLIVHTEPVDRSSGRGGNDSNGAGTSGGRARKGRKKAEPVPEQAPGKPTGGPTAAQIAAAAHAAALSSGTKDDAVAEPAEVTVEAADSRTYDDALVVTAEPVEAAPKVSGRARRRRATAAVAAPPAVDVDSAGDTTTDATAGAHDVSNLSDDSGAAHSSAAPVADDHGAEEAAAYVPVDTEPVADDATAKAAAKRKKRKRVVAPAGPPVNLDESSDDQ
ncbi:Rne/Rng family ribonuclease [Rudaeicoccus suwonensis]|uniref:Rne/Rng family ribonuclease n=1 Tax=Rudaeicoccus suwonensis TaxID=657409 RepID=UPI003CCC6755